jgi:hypothetical protein
MSHEDSLSVYDPTGIGVFYFIFRLLEKGREIYDEIDFHMTSQVNLT